MGDGLDDFLVDQHVVSASGRGLPLGEGQVETTHLLVVCLKMCHFKNDLNLLYNPCLAYYIKYENNIRSSR